MDRDDKVHRWSWPTLREERYEPNIKGYLRTLGGLAVILMIILALLWLIRLGYSLTWTGFGGYTTADGGYQPAKTLWDWMALLIIPAVLAVGGILFNRAERRAERRTASERTQDISLQSYFDVMTELIIDKSLGKSEENAEVRDIARARTLTVLRGLNGERKGMLLQFLYEANLISGEPIVVLGGADLKNIDLCGANLANIDLSRTDLEGARLDKTNLRNANFSEAILDKANLMLADISHANLSGAHITDAKLQGTNLEHSDLSQAWLWGSHTYDANMNMTNLHKAILNQARMLNTHLKKADLREAKLKETELYKADLREANLNGADLSKASLREVDLCGANLQNAKVTDEQLAKAKTLEGTTLPDGTQHE